MKRAEVAILDEPTSGLDPHATFELLEMIRGLKKAGVAVLISSHLLDRVQSVCDRVALFNKGKIALMGTVVELANQVLGARPSDRWSRPSGIDVAGRAARHRGRAAGRAGRRGGLAVVADRDVRATVAQRDRRRRRLADAARRPAAQPRRGLHALLRGGRHAA